MLSYPNNIQPLEPALRQIVAWRVWGDAIVFTNGCFDLLHPGHVDCLGKARQEGDRLVVGLNTDASVQRLKGPSRPIQSEQARALVLAGLQAVDLVILFEEDTPLRLIQSILPDVLVKGGDYKLDEIVGAKEVMDHGGSVKTIPFLEGYSSSSIIEKIQRI
ncbi:MAG: D-glycero-beta-D-manno-heptose 1-phosphate adenylyltransferase [Bacteroidota bacterium]